MTTININDPLGAARIVSLREAAAAVGVSLATFRRLIASGSGPTVVRISPRRVGVRVPDLVTWTDHRAEKPEAA